MEKLNSELVETIAQALHDAGHFPTKTDFEKLKSDLEKAPPHPREGEPGRPSISKMIRGLSAKDNRVISESTKEADINYVKALDTGSQPGSFLVPSLQADEIIGFLSVGGVVRAANARIWDLRGQQKLNVPVATASPTVEYLGENTAQTATDPNLSQMPFDLKTRRSLIAFPNELLKASTPGIDKIITELLGLSFAEKEDNAFFATTTVSGGPTSFYADANTTSHLVGESANGGSLAYSDLLRTLQKSSAAKAKGPMMWFASPRTFYQRILGLLDANSRPIVTSEATGPVQFRLFGSPVFISPEIPEDQTNGSGTNQSYLVYGPPRSIHIADSGFEIAVSGEFFFSANQTAIRGTHMHDFGLAPAASLVKLIGID